MQANIKTIEDNTNHFNGNVPQALRNKLFELAEEVKSNFIADIPGWPESLGTADIDAIYGYDPGGFSPCQLGGFRISELYRSDVDSTYHFTKEQTKEMNARQDRCYQDFANDYEKEIAAYYKGLNQPVPDSKELSYSDYEAMGLENDFSDYENDYFDPAMLSLEIWVDDSKAEGSFVQTNKEPSNVYVRLSINYTDQPYYRNKYDETIFEFNMHIAEIETITNEGFIERLLKEYNKAEV